MPAIRVFLLTCRRPHLLPRALASLRAQTFSDWVCEVHNDAPEDPGPERLLATVADPRFVLRQHATNLGPVATFNLAFRGGPEPFLAILEDDNWWEPQFLARALAALEAHPDANVVWANLRLWREEADGSWTDTGGTVWPVADGPPRCFRWPEPLQLTDALHSNGAMVCRTRASATALVPEGTPFAIIEPARERLLGGDWLLLEQPLAHFALTRETARGRDRLLWAQAQLLAAASFLEAVPAPADVLARIWERQRNLSPPSTAVLFHLACAGIRPLGLLRHARPLDWGRFLAGVGRRPLLFWRTLRFRRDHAGVWREFRLGARRRSAENPPDFARALTYRKDSA